MSSVPEPTAELVREELAKIVASEPFHKGEKLCRFLRYAVEESLAGRPENLKEYNIGVVVYERRADYDTRTDSTVRVEASRLRNKLIEYYAGVGAGSPLRVELPKGTYVPRFVELAAPVTATHVPVSRRGWIYGAGGGMLATAGLWWGWQQSRPTVSVLVAPFLALDGNAAAARELTGGLLREIPQRTGWSVRELAETNETEVRARAKASGATYLLSGSVRAGNAVVTLETAEAGYKLWSRTFPAGDVGAIAQALRAPANRPPSPGTTNPEAAREFLEAHRILSNSKPFKRVPKEWPPHVKESLPHFERAVQLDANFAAAWVGIASALDQISQWADDSREVERRMKQAAERALQIDDTIPEAHRVLGSLALYREWNVREAAAQYSRAVELDPRNADLQRAYASVLSVQGRHDEAAREISRAELAAPGVSTMSSNLAEVMFLARRHAESRQQARRAIALADDNAFAHWLLAVNSQLDGDVEEAEREYKWCLRKYALDSRAISGLAHLRAVQGRTAEARTILEGAIRQWGTQDGWNCTVAMVSWAIGDKDRARQALRRALEFRDGSAPFVLVDPRYDGMRDTPEYRELERRVNR